VGTYLHHYTIYIVTIQSSIPHEISK